MVKPITSGAICEYCGDPAQCRDHVIPRSYLRNTGKPNWRRDWTVYSCNQCNNVLGSRLLITIEERAEFLLDYYQRKRRYRIGAQRLERLAMRANQPLPIVEPKSKPIAKRVKPIASKPLKRLATVSPLLRVEGDCVARAKFERRVGSDLEAFLEQKETPLETA